MLTFSSVNDILHDVRSYHRIVTRSMTDISDQHAWFLAVCLLVSPHADIEEISTIFPNGGQIGYDGARATHPTLVKYKLMRLHAAFHDAFGFMKAHYNTGPGYCYAAPSCPSFFWLGHLSGLTFWLFVKICKPSQYISTLI